MCGRFTLRTAPEVLMAIFQIPGIPSGFGARFNIAPTQNVLVIRAAQDIAEGREAAWMRWGLIPSWAKDASIGSRMINARAETVSEKPAFRAAFTRRRCLIPADGFYEWQRLSTGKKQPWWIHQPDESPFAMAGLWETWQPPASAADVTQHTSEYPRSPGAGSTWTTCTILTTEASRDVRELHDRMPVILPPESWNLWLSPQASPGQLSECLRPLPSGHLQKYCVSQQVNRAGVESQDLLSPISPPEPFTEVGFGEDDIGAFRFSDF
jgi:putative SOS response-associated peptidase YedK